MPEFSYVAQSSSGTIERGRIHGPGPADVKEQLSRSGRRLVGIKKARNQTFDLNSLLARVRNWRPRSIRSSDLELMLQQIAVLLESGLELTSALGELRVLSPNRRLQQLCAELTEAVENGKSFSTSLSETGFFPPVVVQLARVGEETGELAVTLQRAAEFVENRRRVRGNLLSALAYPLLVAIAACAVATYLVGWAIPKLGVFLHAMGRKLPAMTQSLLDISSMTQQYGAQLGVFLFAGLLALALIYAWRPGRYRIDRALLRLPLFGPLMQMAATQQLASAVALMLRSGVFLPEALEVAAKLHSNQFLSAQVAGAPDKLATGNDLAEALSGSGFAPMLSSMIGVGERTGNLPHALEHVAKFYAVQVDTTLKRLGRLIEPTIIMVVGGIVGYVYIAFFMALLSAGGNFK